jgi:peroxiredoxin
MPISAGTVAPDFDLPTVTDGAVSRVNLSDHRGKDVVVLLFFPAVNTPVCTHQMCHSKDEIPALEDAVVYGISVDLPWAQSLWKDLNKMAVTLLSDHDLNATRAYDAVWPNFGGFPVAARASFVIDRRGMITYSSVTPSLGDLPDAVELQRAVEAAVAL